MNSNKRKRTKNVRVKNISPLSFIDERKIFYIVHEITIS